MVFDVNLRKCLENMFLMGAIRLFQQYIGEVLPIYYNSTYYIILHGGGLLNLLGHSGDFGNAAKMVGNMSKSVMQLISIGF